MIESADSRLKNREVNPLIFWGIITVALAVSLVLILNAVGVSGGVYVLLLIPIVAYLAIMGFFLMYVSRLNKERSKLLSERIEVEQGRAEEFARLNKELSDYAKQLFDKDFELTLANKRLQSLEQAKSKFISVTTHQLRTPLSAIKWTFHMLLKENLGKVTSEQKDFLQKGYDSTQRMIAIVNDLLNVDFIEADKSDYNFLPTKIVELMEGVIFEFKIPAESKKLDFKFIKPQNLLPDLKIDPVKISMVLENLIDNAIKYCPDKSKVTIYLKDDRINTADGSVEVVVADTGIGIASADRDKIFHRFFRAPNAIKIKTDGSGLGLYIAKDIIERHGGQMWFESKEGAGSTFHFTLPLARH